MKRWHRLLDGWLVGAVLLLAALVLLLGCIPSPRPVLPPVRPANVVFEPVCTRRDGITAGWTATLRVNGSYRIKKFNGPYPPILDYSYPARAPFTPGADPNRVYVIVNSVPWVLEYTSDPTRFPWVETSARINTRPPVTCSV